MPTPAAWHEASRHIIHREQGYVCPSCPEAADKHNSDCIVFCLVPPGEKCSVLHGCDFCDIEQSA